MRFKPVIISHHMLMGLKEGQEKMSKSDPDSAIFMEDAAEDVKRKVLTALCVLWIILIFIRRHCLDFVLFFHTIPQCFLSLSSPYSSSRCKYVYLSLSLFFSSSLGQEGILPSYDSGEESDRGLLQVHYIRILRQNDHNSQRGKQTARSLLFLHRYGHVLSSRRTELFGAASLSIQSHSQQCM